MILKTNTCFLWSILVYVSLLFSFFKHESSYFTHFFNQQYTKVAMDEKQTGINYTAHVYCNLSIPFVTLPTFIQKPW